MTPGKNRRHLECKCQVIADARGKSDMKVLLIEDSRFFRAAIERSLLRAGHQVTSIADGREALFAARSTLPDVILLDMMLPGLDGTCVLSELKQDASTSHIPVIVLTGLSRQNEDKLKKAGAAALIEKSALGQERTADSLLLAIMGVLDPLAAYDEPMSSGS